MSPRSTQWRCGRPCSHTPLPARPRGEGGHDALSDPAANPLDDRHGHAVADGAVSRAVGRAVAVDGGPAVWQTLKVLALTGGEAADGQAIGNNWHSPARTVFGH